MASVENRSNKLRGLILGTAVGDALGLPAEGLKPKAIKQLGWTAWKHRFFFGRGMVSDDTDHTVFVAQALLSYSKDSNKFKSSLAWKLRWWFLSLPAGIGLGTAKAIIKLWFFIPLRKSGVWSAGNGPAMRSAVIGACFAGNNDKIKEFTRCSTELTHRDPRALVGATAISYAASEAMLNTEAQLPDFIQSLRLLSNQDDSEWLEKVNLIESGLESNLSVEEFIRSMGLQKGITGYVYHTVPVAIYAWLRHYGDFRTTLESVLNCGGDTDTVGAITGALAGATVGEKEIPTEWIKNILEWPRSIPILSKIADRLADDNINKERVKYCWAGVILRNIFMLIVVLGHVLLRLIPARIRCYMKA